VDCDAFFVQVARQVDPEGAGRTELLLVGGRSGRGVVTSASYAARAFGVRSGMPMSEALRRCPGAVAVPVPREACVERSRAIRGVLEGLAPVVEAASIDEFYLDLTGTGRLRRGESLGDAAVRIRAAVADATGIAVSIGVGSNRLVAKLAAGRAKPRDPAASGVHVVEPGEEGVFLASFGLREIPGVGPALAEALAGRGVRTVAELLAVERPWLERWIGEGRAGWLLDRARGIDRTPVTAGGERKSISSERTFGQDVAPGPSGDGELERRLLGLVLSVGGTLRDRGLRARTVTVKLRDGDFSTRTRSRTLPHAIESDRAIYQVAREMLAELRARRRPTRLLGVGVSGFDDEGPQLDLLEGDPDAPPPAVETERDRAISRVSDRVRARFGEGALRPGRVVEEGRRERDSEA
jgi:DNA polymerase IV